MSEKISIDKGVIYAIEDATNSVFIDQNNLGHLFDFLGKLGIDSDECDLILKGNPPGIKRLKEVLLESAERVMGAVTVGTNAVDNCYLLLADLGLDTSDIDSIFRETDDNINISLLVDKVSKSLSLSSTWSDSNDKYTGNQLNNPAVSTRIDFADEDEFMSERENNRLNLQNLNLGRKLESIGFTKEDVLNIAAGSPTRNINVMVFYLEDEGEMNEDEQEV